MSEQSQWRKRAFLRNDSPPRFYPTNITIPASTCTLSHKILPTAPDMKPPSEVDPEHGLPDASQPSSVRGKGLVKGCILKIRAAISTWPTNTETGQLSTNQKTTPKTQSIIPLN